MYDPYPRVDIITTMRYNVTDVWYLSVVLNPLQYNNPLSTPHVDFKCIIGTHNAYIKPVAVALDRLVINISKIRVYNPRPPSTNTVWLESQHG